MNKSRAKIIGLNACINAIGRNFYFSHKNDAMSFYGIVGNEMMCVTGIGKIKRKFGEIDEFEKQVICYVNLITGKIRF